MKNIPVRHIAQNAKEPGLSGGFAIRKLEMLLQGNDLSESLHRHDFFYMLVLEKAAGSHEIDFEPCEVADHSIFLMRPGQVHQLTLKAGSKGYLIQFKTDFYHSQNPTAKELLRRVSHKKNCSIGPDNFQRLVSLLDAVEQEFSAKSEGHEDAIKSYLNIFFLELVRNRQNLESSTGADANQYSQEKLERFFEFLEAEITHNKQVSHYAGRLNLSAYQLGAITKALLNKTPSDLIGAHVVLEAKRQLLATSGQVSQIAYDLGYDDVSYFIRFFKKHTGHSPESFRNISK